MEIEFSEILEKGKRIDIQKRYLFQTKCQKIEKLPNDSSAKYSSTSKPIIKNYVNFELLMNKIDARKPQNPCKWPFCPIGVVEDYNRKYYGTGALIGRNIVLTAATNVFDNYKSGLQSSDVEFFTGVNNGDIYKKSKVIKIFVPDLYKKGVDEEDFAILILEDNLGDECGYYGIREFPTDLNSQIEIYGYPGDKMIEQNNGKYFKYLYGMKGDFEFYNNLITYSKIDTMPGQTGSPICIEANLQSRYIIGVHVRGHRGKTNEGVYLSKARIDLINEWVNTLTKESYTNENKSLTLDLSCSHLSSEVLDYLSKREDLRLLSKLNLWKNNIGSEGVGKLCKCNLKMLTTLILRKNEIGSEGVNYLSKCTFKNLTTLNIKWNNIGSEGMNYLSKCNFKILKTLKLSGNKIGNEGVNYLSKCDFKMLTSLDLSWNNLCCEGVDYLSKCSFKILSTLKLRGNNIGSKGVLNLSKCFFKMLTTLDLSCDQIGSKGVETLSDCDFKMLTTLYLDSNKIGNEGINNLSKCNLKNLTTLGLNSNNLDNEGMNNLSKCDFKMLTTLDLSYNSIGREGVNYLSKCDFSMMITLNFENNKTSIDHKESLSKGFLNLKKIY